MVVDSACAVGFVTTTLPFCSSDSSSSPNERPPVFTPFFLFFLKAVRVAGSLYLARQYPAEINKSLTYRPSGVVVPLAARVASRETCSSASARLLRKSERWTRPTVCSLSRSSAVGACEVKRGFGVEEREGV